MSQGIDNFDRIVFGDTSPRPASHWPRAAVKATKEQSDAVHQPTRLIDTIDEKPTRADFGELNLPDSLA